MVETPGSCIVTPYTASAACMVRGLWVMTRNWRAVLELVAAAG